MAAMLIDHGEALNACDECDQTALAHAICQGNDDVTELLLKRGADPAAENWLAFSIAVRVGSVPLVSRPLDLGADPNVRDDDDPTPLMEAVGRGNRELVRLLLDAGADLEKTAEGGATAFDLAVQHREKEIVKLLEPRVTPSARTLQAAVQARDTRLVERLIARGVPVNFCDEQFGHTPLSWAAENGHTQILMRLEQAGATVNYGSQRLHNAALLKAVEHQNVDGVHQALAAGAQTDLKQKATDRSPLMQAALDGNPEIVKLLLAAGADPSLLASSGDNPLLAAVTSRQIDLARRLLNAGAKPRAEDADYMDVLQWEQRAAAAAYQRSIHEIQEVTGLRPEPIAGLPGAHSFRLSIPEEESSCDQVEDRTEAMLQWSKKFKLDYQSLTEQMQAVIDELQQRVTERGYHLLDGGMPLGCGPLTRFLVLLPTADPLAAMAAFGTHGNDDELSNRELIAWFRDFRQEHPFVLRGCKHDTVVIQLERPLEDPKAWAKRLVDFDSDIWPDELPRFEKHLETATRIHFWWD